MKKLYISAIAVFLAATSATAAPAAPKRVISNNQVNAAKVPAKSVSSQAMQITDLDSQVKGR